MIPYISCLVAGLCSAFYIIYKDLPIYLILIVFSVLTLTAVACAQCLEEEYLSKEEEPPLNLKRSRQFFAILFMAILCITSCFFNFKSVPDFSWPDFGINGDANDYVTVTCTDSVVLSPNNDYTTEFLIHVQSKKDWNTINVVSDPSEIEITEEQNDKNAAIFKGVATKEGKYKILVSGTIGKKPFKKEAEVTVIKSDVTTSSLFNIHYEDTVLLKGSNAAVQNIGVTPKGDFEIEKVALTCDSKSFSSTGKITEENGIVYTDATFSAEGTYQILVTITTEDKQAYQHTIEVTAKKASTTVPPESSKPSSVLELSVSKSSVTLTPNNNFTDSLTVTPKLNLSNYDDWDRIYADYHKSGVEIVKSKNSKGKEFFVITFNGVEAGTYTIPFIAEIGEKEYSSSVKVVVKEEIPDNYLSLKYPRKITTYSSNNYYHEEEITVSLRSEKNYDWTSIEIEEKTNFGVEIDLIKDNDDTATFNLIFNEDINVSEDGEMLLRVKAMVKNKVVSKIIEIKVVQKNNGQSLSGNPEKHWEQTPQAVVVTNEKPGDFSLKFWITDDSEKQLDLQHFEVIVTNDDTIKDSKYSIDKGVGIYTATIHGTGTHVITINYQIPGDEIRQTTYTFESQAPTI